MPLDKRVKNLQTRPSRVESIDNLFTRWGPHSTPLQHVPQEEGVFILRGDKSQNASEVGARETVKRLLGETASSSGIPVGKNNHVTPGVLN